MSEQTLESAATAAWAKALGPQRVRWRERTTAGTMMASARASMSRTRLVVAPRPQAMALWPSGRGEAGGQMRQRTDRQVNREEDVQVSSQMIGQVDKDR